VNGKPDLQVAMASLIRFLRSLMLNRVHLEVPLGDRQAGVAELPSTIPVDNHSAARDAAQRFLT